MESPQLQKYQEDFADLQTGDLFVNKETIGIDNGWIRSEDPTKETWPLTHTFPLSVNFNRYNYPPGCRWEVSKACGLICISALDYLGVHWGRLYFYSSKELSLFTRNPQND